MNRILALMVAGRLAGTWAPDAKAAEPAPEGRQERGSNPGTERHVRRLASEFGVPEAEVTGLREKGLGWGELRHALAISRKSGRPLSEVLQARDSGLGWGEIAKRYDVKLGEKADGASERRGKAEARSGRDAVIERRGQRGHEGRAQGRGPKR